MIRWVSNPVAWVCTTTSSQGLSRVLQIETLAQIVIIDCCLWHNGVLRVCSPRRHQPRLDTGSSSSTPHMYCLSHRQAAILVEDVAAAIHILITDIFEHQDLATLASPSMHRHILPIDCRKRCGCRLVHVCFVNWAVWILRGEHVNWLLIHFVVDLNALSLRLLG